MSVSYDLYIRWMYAWLFPKSTSIGGCKKPKKKKKKLMRKERQKVRDERKERETKFFILFVGMVYIILMSYI